MPSKLFVAVPVPTTALAQLSTTTAGVPSGDCAFSLLSGQTFLFGLKVIPAGNVTLTFFSGSAVVWPAPGLTTTLSPRFEETFFSLKRLPDLGGDRRVNGSGFTGRLRRRRNDAERDQQRDYCDQDFLCVAHVFPQCSNLARLDEVPLTQLSRH